MILIITIDFSFIVTDDLGFIVHILMATTNGITIVCTIAKDICSIVILILIIINSRIITASIHNISVSISICRSISIRNYHYWIYYCSQ